MFALRNTSGRCALPTWLFAVLPLLLATHPAAAQVSVARQWNEELLDAIRIDTPRPTVHSRNLFHTSAAMYDAWAAYDDVAKGYLHQETLTSNDLAADRNEAISFAAYRMLTARFANSPGAATSLASFDQRMTSLGYDPSFVSTAGNSPAALGNRIAQTILDYGYTDGANELGGYADTENYQPVNPPMIVAESGTTLTDPNRWQPLTIGAKTQTFLSPHWGNVTPFALQRNSPAETYHDPGMPPQLGGAGDAAFKDAAVRVIQFSSWLDPDQGVTIDISPGAIGNDPLGSNAGSGHPLNPVTGEPYAPNVVNRGDYGRILAEFWADGPHSETPPGHWNVIANSVSDSPQLEKRIGGTGPIVDDLEWDVKTYFALNGAVHDSAITAWDIKEAYDYVRPISAIRYMGGLGQSSDATGPSYHPNGLPLIDDLIEVISAETTAAGGKHAHLAGHENEIAIFAWQGPPEDDANGYGGVDWILAEDWMPYQLDTFVTPPFAGYTSGHSTFSRAAAEVLTDMTGSEFFPGGLAEYAFQADDYLSFEDGPSEDMVLQWATYFDASDQAGISRLYGGIHVDADDLAGRVCGSGIGSEAFAMAQAYFAGVPEPTSGLLLVLGMAAFAAMTRSTRRR